MQCLLLLAALAAAPAAAQYREIENVERQGVALSSGVALRILVRNESVGLKLSKKDVPGFKKLTLIWRERADTYREMGLGTIRDDLFRRTGTEVRARKKSGWQLALAGVIDEHWTASTGFDKLHDRRVGYLNESVWVGACWFPLGDNALERWNYSLAFTPNHAHQEYFDGTAHRERAGYGYSIGPVWQYRLDWLPVPFRRRSRLARRTYVDRFQAGLTYTESEIHPPTLTLDQAFVAFMTRHVRFSVGAAEELLKGSGHPRFDLKTSVSVMFDPQDFRIRHRKPPEPPKGP